METTINIDPGFWSDFLANLSATFLGILVGIPVALYVERLLEGAQEKSRKAKILRLLRGELLQNLAVLSGWQRSEDKYAEIILMQSFLRHESWDSFSDGGELSWISDPELLDIIAEAYFTIRSVNLTSEKYEALRKNEVALSKPAFTYFDQSIAESIPVIQKALQKISEATDSS